MAGGDWWGRPSHLGSQIHPGTHHCWRCVRHPEHGQYHFISYLAQCNAYTTNQLKINSVPLKILWLCAKDTSPKISLLPLSSCYITALPQQVTARSAGSGAASDDVTKNFRILYFSSKPFPSFLPSPFLDTASSWSSRVSTALPAAQVRSIPRSESPNAARRQTTELSRQRKSALYPALLLLHNTTRPAKIGKNSPRKYEMILVGQSFNAERSSFFPAATRCCKAPSDADAAVYVVI